MLVGIHVIRRGPAGPRQKGYPMLYLCDNQHPQIAHTEAICPLCLAEARWVEDALKFADYKAEEEERRELERKEKML